MFWYSKMFQYPPIVYYRRTLKQNVLILPCCILPTHFYNSINIGSTSHFSSSHMHQSHHLLRCHATVISYSFNCFLCFAFSKFNMPSQKPDKNNGIKIFFIIISIFKITITKIYTKNTHSITHKYASIESSLKQNIFSSVYKAVKSILIILLVTNQSGTNFIAARQSATALSHICWV